MAEELKNETFLYDDFFSPADDRGVEIRPKIRGREVPMRVKRGISLVDAGEAREAATKKVIDPATGMVRVLSVDEVRMNISLLKKAIIEWPFVKDGKPLPITEKSIGELNGDAAEAILGEIQKLMAARQEALAPFENRSDAA
jgi:hypothetical protein